MHRQQESVGWERMVRMRGGTVSLVITVVVIIVLVLVIARLLGA